VTIAIGGSGRVAPREANVAQEEAIVHYSHVGRFLAAAIDRVDVPIAYTVYTVRRTRARARARMYVLVIPFRVTCLGLCRLCA